MIQSLSRLLTDFGGPWTYLILAGLILFWWFILRGIQRLLGLRGHRPARVVILTHRAVFLAGAIFLFDLVLAPVVLLVFSGAAMACLLICAASAVTYLVTVRDHEGDEDRTGSFEEPGPFTGDRRFGDPFRR